MYVFLSKVEPGFVNEVVLENAFVTRLVLKWWQRNVVIWGTLIS